jgi:hypothetical protein
MKYIYILFRLPVILQFMFYQAEMLHANVLNPIKKIPKRASACCENVLAHTMVNHSKNTLFIFEFESLVGHGDIVPIVEQRA